MRYRKIVIVLIAICAPSSAMADLYPFFEEFLKRDNFDSLAMYSYVSGSCPFNKEQIRNHIRGELLRVRLKVDQPEKFNLTVKAGCVDSRLGEKLVGYAIAVQVYFGKELMLYDRDLGNIYMISADSVGIQYIRDSIKERVGAAITAYLEANLGD